MPVRRKKKKPVKKKPARKPVLKSRKKKPVRRKILSVKKKSLTKLKKPKLIKRPKEKVVGVITHYFPHVKAGVFKVKVPLVVGETIRIKG